jgi:hypothetical protein
MNSVITDRYALYHGDCIELLPALLGNMVRVIATVLAAGAYGAERATSGTLHEFAGLLTSAFAVLLVMALGTVLARRTASAPARKASA